MINQGEIMLYFWSYGAAENELTENVCWNLKNGIVSFIDFHCCFLWSKIILLFMYLKVCFLWTAKYQTIFALYAQLHIILLYNGPFIIHTLYNRSLVPKKRLMLCTKYHWTLHTIQNSHHSIQKVCLRYTTYKHVNLIPIGHTWLFFDLLISW